MTNTLSPNRRGFYVNRRGIHYVKITPHWIKGYRPVSRYVMVKSRELLSAGTPNFPVKISNAFSEGEIQMTTTNKYNTDPKTLNAFLARENKKDSFERWYRRQPDALTTSFQKYGAI